MHVVPFSAFGRFVPLALAGLFVASACSAWAADLAVVPGAPRPATNPVRVAEATPAPRFTPKPAEQAATVNVGKKAAPTQKVVKLRPRPKAGPFQMDLYDQGDLMHQATKDMCVAGSTQTMMNIIDPGKPNRSIPYQKKLYQRGRELSPNKTKLGPIGMDLTGWAELLNTGGYGPYVVDGAGTRRGAIRMAAKALRMTNKPVGLVTWRGAHSWVMSGFTATADPAYTNDFKVKAVYIQDTWYPYVSTIWGASRPPDALVPVAALAEDYLPYQRPRARYPKRDGKFMLILPELPRGTITR